MLKLIINYALKSKVGPLMSLYARTCTHTRVCAYLCMRTCTLNIIMCVCMFKSMYILSFSLCRPSGCLYIRFLFTVQLTVCRVIDTHYELAKYMEPASKYIMPKSPAIKFLMLGLRGTFHNMYCKGPAIDIL